MSSIRQNAVIATLAVSGSRVAGLFREIVFAFFFGAGPALDAFVTAFRIPNLLRDLFAEGALSNAFVTVFSKKSVQEGDEKAFQLANQVIWFIWLTVGSLTLLGVWFSPFVVKMVASGFTGEKLALTIFLNRLLFPFILFVCLASVAMGMLNAKGKYALPQSASTFFNVTSIGVGLACAYFLSPAMMESSFKTLFGLEPKIAFDWAAMSRAMIGMAIGTLLGGLVQWFVQVPFLYRMGFQNYFSLNFKDPGLREVLRLVGPAILGGAAVQNNVLVNTNFASYLVDGSVAWLNYAFRLMQFPIGVFGVSVALATTPALAGLVASKKEPEFVKTLRDSSHMTLFLCIPSALGLIVFAPPIISLIYQYGQFGVGDTLEAAHALMAYALGLSFYALIKIYQPAFLAFGDAKTPMLISLSSIGINFILNFVFVFVFKLTHWGLALGTSSVALWNACLLILILRKKIPLKECFFFKFQIIKMVFSAILAILLSALFYQFLSRQIETDHFLSRLITLLPAMGSTVLIYYLACQKMGVLEANLMRQWVIKKMTRKS